MGILLRVAGLNMLQTDDSPLCPGDEGSADVSRAVITAHKLQLTMPRDNLIQRPYDPLGRQKQINVNRQRLPIEVINNIQQPVASAIGELVMAEKLLYFFHYFGKLLK